MKFKDKKGSISIFVLVALLFMASVLLLMFASSINKSKAVKEQFNTISGIYAYSGGDEGAYDKSYTDLRQKNKRIFSFENAADANKTIFENTSTIELTKTFDEDISNYRIYGNSMQGVGDLTDNIFDMSKVICNGTIEGNKVIAKDTDFYLTAGTYSISFQKSFENDIFLRKGQVTNGYFSSSTGNTFFASFTFEEDQYLRISHFVDGGYIYNIMIIEGSYTSSAMPKYEPYGKYKIPIKVTGKNLFDETTLIDLGFTIQDDGRYYDNSTNNYVIWKNTGNIQGSLKIQAQIDYTTTSGFSIQTFYTDGTYKWEDGITDSNKTVERVQLSNAAKRETWISNIMITTDTTLKNYEPYKEQAYNMYLDQPLRKIEDIADYIDYINGKVVRKIGVIESYNGETISEQYISNTGDLSIGATVYYQLPEESYYEEVITLSELKTYEDYTKIEVLTEVPPSRIELKYQGYTLD